MDPIAAPIVCNQIEYHALIDRTSVLNRMRAHGLPVVAHVPLAQGQLANTRSWRRSDVVRAQVRRRRR